ncbi:FecR family protein [Chitinophaga sp. Cy-1792]|uniref:FecR family protein n=1 Tax=Chitinophaga sp. Cy-1792 TaxID=2608339 RepID=UPI0014211CCE|nr:FecR domain-containing protein [Chitinophaga sp. Cy-1792]NIG53093.1 FecR family protein [Chitinophaga sp. Cy-1792]
MDKAYHLFSKEDFLEDADFLEWVRYARPEAETFWTLWQQEQPANLQEMLEAKAVVSGIYRLERMTPAADIKAAVWKNIQAGISEEQKIYPLKSRSNWWKYAAAAVVIPAAIVFGYYKYINRTIVIKAGYGQIVKLHLPDSTAVTLNGNSVLTYGPWKDGKREVWLEGEGLFNVTATNKAFPFIAHAGKVKVEVLGTVFNIKSRRDNAEVYLQSGKVRVTADGHQQPIILAPEQKASYDATRFMLMSTPPDNSNASTAWLESKMQLKNTTVKEIIETLQDTYGYTIILQNSSIANRSIDGTLSLDNINTVIFELQAILNVSIEKNNDTLTFKSNGQRGY